MSTSWDRNFTPSCVVESNSFWRSSALKHHGFQTCQKKAGASEPSQLHCNNLAKSYPIFNILSLLDKEFYLREQHLSSMRFDMSHNLQLENSIKAESASSTHFTLQWDTEISKWNRPSFFCRSLNGLSTLANRFFISDLADGSFNVSQMSWHCVRASFNNCCLSFSSSSIRWNSTIFHLISWNELENLPTTVLISCACA